MSTQIDYSLPTDNRSWGSLGHCNTPLMNCVDHHDFAAARAFCHCFFLHVLYLGLWGLVNNAGIQGSLGPMEWLTQEDFVRIMDVNVLGLVRVIRTFLPLLKRSTGGARIVNTSSIFGKLSIPYSAPYCMTKHAVEALSDALR